MTHANTMLAVNYMKTLIENNKNNLALIIGNGINRYGQSSDKNSWESLLFKLVKDYLTDMNELPDGVSYTELYDVLEIKGSLKSLQQEFCNMMKSWQPYEHHKRIVKWAFSNQIPILTTNFEKVLADCGGYKRRRTVKGRFTAFYPWETYFGASDFDNPCLNFGIWHINGTQEYRQSIRLGLSHYMGSVQRARSWFHRGGDRRLFSGKSHSSWRGAKTWLHIIFNSKLIIFGLALKENEVFLRWLLIERARYFQKFPSRKKEAWYIQEKPVSDQGKKFFLDGVGVETIVVPGYDAIYGKNVWE